MAAGERHADRLDGSLLRIAGICVFASVAVNLANTAVSVAQRSLIVTFGSNQAVVAWTVTAYTLTEAAAIPLSGWAADRIGTKRLFMISVLGFTLGSVLCAVAPNIACLIIFRAVQGGGGGILMPLVITILAREAGPNRLARLMSVMGIPLLLGPMAGPILGGWLIDDYGWQWIFWINVPIGLITVALAAIAFPGDHTAPSETLDLVGMLLLSPGLATFLYGLSTVPARGTVADRHVLIPATAGLVLMGAFVFHALYRADRPLIDLRLFRNRVVTVANATIVFVAAGFSGAVLLVPSYFQQLLRETPLQVGIHMIPLGLGAAVTIPTSSVLMDRHGAGKVVLGGVTLISVGMGTLAFGAAEHAAYVPTLLIGLTIVGMGIGSIMLQLTTVAVQTLAPHQIARGSTLVSVNQQLSASASTALMSVILTSQFNRSANIAAANRLEALNESATRRGIPLDPSQIPPRTLNPDFGANLLHDLSQAYTVVFVYASVVMLVTFLPAVFLPMRAAITSAPLREPIDPEFPEMAARGRPG
ncbi:putative transport protein HsrA [Mycobacterium marinum]|uniref:DHA2 family efflux MFS transporter permease subunit n=1 Tax=Mycobacterium marinum TaxID=1781 RepID=UPI0003587C7A|nr:DHA2 family efflux MFS transporter permease subunit [Mycobacterium marinum]AXN42042.1 putative transport protein HsrA [Mycobacterium marinum]AXN47510.1 putative transport protein HsrA [Mycobacterium marinum]EPQ72353.1 Inner membrane component of tripartite multidrug resistance system [Mycobacterium marinum str. Europe]RFZ04392.1 putative transport protein HsrA [Mycobacterium marinum]RFZ23956.1 putative transport protein HsrA [Mycobacterium marinum]